MGTPGLFTHRNASAATWLHPLPTCGRWGRPCIRRGGRARTFDNRGQLHRDPCCHRQRGSAAARSSRAAVHVSGSAAQCNCCTGNPHALPMLPRPAVYGPRRPQSLHRRPGRPRAGPRPLLAPLPCWSCPLVPYAPSGPYRLLLPARGLPGWTPVGRCPLAGGHAAGSTPSGGRWPESPVPSPWVRNPPVPGGWATASRHGAPAPGFRRGSPRTCGDAPARPPPAAGPLGALAIVAQASWSGCPVPREQWAPALAGRRAGPCVTADRAGSPRRPSRLRFRPGGTLPPGVRDRLQSTSPAGGVVDPGHSHVPRLAGTNGFRPATAGQLARGLRLGRFHSSPAMSLSAGGPSPSKGGAGVARRFTWQPGRGGRTWNRWTSVSVHHPPPAAEAYWCGNPRPQSRVGGCAAAAFRHSLSTFRARS